MSTTSEAPKMSKMEKFIRKNFNLSEKDLTHMPRLLNRCDQEIEDSGMGQISEYEMADIVDDELSKIEDEEAAKEKLMSQC